jgi:hypothetical protein
MAAAVAAVVLAIPMLVATMRLTDAGGVTLFLSYAVPGLVLAVRRPGQPIAWLLLLMATGLALGTTVVTATLEELQTGTADAFGAFTAWANGTGWSLVFAGLVGLALVFPSGSLPTGRWRAVATGCIGLAVPIELVLVLGPLVNVTLPTAPFGVDVPNPYALPSLPFIAELGPYNAMLWTIAFGIVVVAMLSLLARSRRATGIERLQYRWLAWALVVVGIASSLWAILTNVLQVAAGPLASLIVLVSYPAIPVSVVIAVLRHRLYDIDRLISRTLGWGIATAAVVGVFGLGVLALQSALSDVTQGQPIAVAVATLLAFVVFQPVRERVQAIVDRRFDRPRLALEHSLGAYGERVQHETDLAVLRLDLEQTAITTLRPAAAGLWIRPVRAARRS